MSLTYINLHLLVLKLPAFFIALSIRLVKQAIRPGKNCFNCSALYAFPLSSKTAQSISYCFLILL